ncbi:MAG TPA: hypothetical protein VHO03_05905 [Ignavibacteriales bacterium]|nr:hypothetical protein [Ignavibacteriales bacterium]
MPKSKLYEDREHKEITILGERVVISERNSIESYGLYGWEQRHKGDAITNLVIPAGVISRSLEPYYKSLKWYQVIKKRKVKKMLDINWLNNNLPVSVILGIFYEIQELENEGLKKKTMGKVDLQEVQKSAGA